MIQKKNNIVFLGAATNYGYGFSATGTKVRFIAKGLSEQGDNCTIHNGISGIRNINERKEWIEDGTAKVVALPKRGLLGWLGNIKRTYSDLKKLYEHDCKNIVITSTTEFHIFIVYVIISRLIGYHISCISHEWATIGSIRWFKRPFAWLYVKSFGYMADSILPISEYIIRKIQHFNKPYYKLPILGDFGNQIIIPTEMKEKTFVYCGAAEYYRVIIILLQAIKQLNIDYKLVLVLGGGEKSKYRIVEYVTSNQLNEKVKILKAVPYDELMNIYRQSSALLIPLDPNYEQDSVRFSQKIAEYLSTGTIVISNNVGEIPYYFTDKKNILCCDYSPEGFADALKWVVDNPKEAIDIGKEGFFLGQKEFDYRVRGRALHNFLLNN